MKTGRFNLLCNLFTKIHCSLITLFCLLLRRAAGTDHQILNWSNGTKVMSHSSVSANRAPWAQLWVPNHQVRQYQSLSTASNQSLDVPFMILLYISSVPSLSMPQPAIALSIMLMLLSGIKVEWGLLISSLSAITLYYHWGFLHVHLNLNPSSHTRTW